MNEALGLDADGLPLFPPLPGGRPAQPATARSVARLVAGLRTAVVTVQNDDVAAMVVFVEHEPVDGVAVRGAHQVTGPDALDEIADAPVEDVRVTEVPTELARVVGSYFLPTEMRGVPAAFVVPEDFVRSLARPGQRGCLLVRTADALGLVFMAGGRVVLAYREDGPVGGLEQVAPLFTAAGATLWARLGPDDSPAVAIAPPPEVTAPAAPPRPVSAPVPPRAPEPPPVPPEPVPTPAVIEAVPVVPPMDPPAVAPLDAALAEVREMLGAHSVRVEAVLRRADPTSEGLRAAARSLRQRRFRLLSQETVELVADRVIAALDRHR
ncbi:MAG TPA: hypothetical protein VOB72_17370 [Candidatus Dormibacteraeota bacterium]|nr:hypothetical protein [Candidatus Dormibacteraeota bacterium]